MESEHVICCCCSFNLFHSDRLNETAWHYNSVWNDIVSIFWNASGYREKAPCVRTQLWIYAVHFSVGVRPVFKIIMHNVQLIALVKLQLKLEKNVSIILNLFRRDSPTAISHQIIDSWLIYYTYRMCVCVHGMHEVR